VRPKRLPTIQDVACHAGVSITTVSHILHGKRHLYTEKTIKKVEDASQELHYHPNSLARSLARRRSYTLGVVIRKLPTSELDMHLGCILSGIFEQTTHYNYQVKLIPWQGETWEALVPTLEDASIDGALLFLTQLSSPLLDWARHTHLPCVAIGSLSEQEPLSSVDVDNEGALYDATRWLISLGHRRIGYIRGEAGHSDTPLREQGYRRAFREAGLPADPTWTCDGDYTREAGVQGVSRLLDACPTLTALLCPTDRAAIGAMEALQKRGLRVPQEISVVGFNDREVAQYVQPPLTTIHKPVAEIGQKAAELLIRQIESDTQAPVRLVLSAPLIQRASVAPVLSAEDQPLLPTGQRNG